MEVLTAAVDHYDMFMEAIQKISPVPIRFDEISGNANGYFHTVDKEIVIQKGMSESQTLKTTIHETAHAKPPVLKSEWVPRLSVRYQRR